MFGLLTGAKWLVYGLLIGALAGYFKGCSDEAARGAAFKATVTALGEAAEERAKKATATYKSIVVTKDKENAKLKSDLSAARKRLRDARGSPVPAAPTGSRRPDLACFARDDLTTALRHFDAGVEGLIGEGTEAAIDLNTVKDWWKAILNAPR